jgi:hypothetical protein
MFKVRSKETGEVYEVYSVKNDKNDYPHFLVYDYHWRDEWSWVSAEQFEEK